MTTHRHVAFFHEGTGILSPLSVLATDDDALKQNTPADHIALDHPPVGRWDHRKHRVDIASGAVIAHEHVPSDEERKLDHLRSTLRKIRQLQSEQHRMLGDLALDREGAKARLQAIEGEIGQLLLQL